MRITILTGKKTPHCVREYLKATVHTSSPFIDPRINAHTDLLLFSFPDGETVCAPSLYGFMTKLSKRVTADVEPRSPYPFDIAYNALAVGKRLFCRISHTSPLLLEMARSRGFELFDIKQGYAKCSAVPVSENALITSDMSVYKAASNAGIDVLVTVNDCVQLDGFEHGFLGGSSLVTEDKVIFCGDISMHPDSERICEFIEKYGKRVVSFPELPLTDIGSPAIIMQ